MRGRRLRWGLVIMALVLAVTAVAVVLWPEMPSRITRENYDRIRVGMRRSEVEAILGPPGDYRTGENEPDDSLPKGQTWTLFGRHPHRSQRLMWNTDTACAEMDTDEAGLVLGGVFVAVRRKDDSAIGRAVWQAKRQWHRWFPEK
jgi:hypothetical protein